MRLHLFDFDGTITNSDSMFEFLKSIYKKKSFYFLLLKSVPIFIKFNLGIISRDEFKEKFLLNFFSKFSKNYIEIKANKFANDYKTYVKISAINYIENLKKDKNNEISIVSASLDIWIKPIAEKMGVNSITTISTFNKNSFTGISGKNCWGEEKVSRIKSIYNLKDFTEIYAYGDSKGDYQMLDIANHKRFKFFN